MHVLHWLTERAHRVTSPDEGYGSTEIAQWYTSYSSSGKGRPLRNDVAALLEICFHSCSRVGTVLDVGCGYGPHIDVIRRHSSRVFGIDRSLPLLGRASRAYDGVIYGDATRLPIQDGSIDAVVSTMTFTDVGEWATLISEAERVLVNDGWLLLVSPHPCFGGPAAQRIAGGDVRVSGAYSSASAWGASSFPRGIRSKVGSQPTTLERYFEPFHSSNLRLWDLNEGLGLKDGPPSLLATVWRLCP
ncbi:class I SAM-dependent methyltransferase [Ornithinimicrobium cerasi]|uniref:class I SAM-dependent methyltransferase n=1 Tax=Ornithinimicrobium cerasi TaxID=2248773 RepID=UPI000BE3F209